MTTEAQAPVRPADVGGASDSARTSVSQAPPVEGRPKVDTRYIALRNFALSITVFNVFGYTLLGFEQPWLWPVACVLVAYGVDIALERISSWGTGREPRYGGRGARGVYEYLLPAHITALAVNMLLYANDQLTPVIFGVIAGVGSKYVFRTRIAGSIKHFMNPSNFGITATLLAFGDWVSVAPPYQFSENVSSLYRIGIPLIIATAGTVLNSSLTRKTPLIVGWLGGFVIQAVLRNFVTDISLTAALTPMTGIAFILFTNYMISDPGTTPFKSRPQFIFGAGCAIVYGVLMMLNVVYTLFFSVTIICVLRGAGWRIYELVGDRVRSVER